MTDRFADTAGWAAWINRDEDHHAAALTAVNEVWDAGRLLVTTSLVLTELTGLFNRFRMPKPQQILTLTRLRSDPSVLVVPVAGELETAAWDLWAARSDKEWSLVDCASFVVMQRHRLTDAITSDHHCEQAGFVRLLK